MEHDLFGKPVSTFPDHALGHRESGEHPYTEERGVKLFMFYVGGRCRNSNIELHDVRFSVGDTIEACYEDLRRQWWGDPESLHLDCWGRVDQADGFDVEVTAETIEAGDERLFFANMGGYDPREFTELHRNILLVAPDAKTAKQRALSLIERWALPHKDNLFEVENLLDLSKAAADGGYRLKLTKAVAEKPFEFRCDYLPIGVPLPSGTFKASC
jgi:hypothetical protein